MRTEIHFPLAYLIKLYQLLRGLERTSDLVCVTERQKVSVTLFICQTVSLTEKYETHVAVRRIEVRMCHCTSKSQKHQQQLTSEFSVNSSKTLTNY